MILTPSQLDEVIGKYCDRVVDEMDTKSMEQLLYELLIDSFKYQNQSDIEEQICGIYDEEYWNQLVKEVTEE
jgi:hypothetical protein